MSKVLSWIKWHKILTAVITAVVILVGFGVSSAMKPKVPEYVTQLSVMGDIRQTVEAVGTVVSERELELRFSGLGNVSQVYVKEGQRVNAGQRLAILKAGNLGASIASQAAALQSAQAELRALQEGTRPEDIAVAEADVAGKRAQLEVARSTVATAEKNLKNANDQLKILTQEATIGLSGQVSTSLSSLSEQLVTAENALFTIDDMLSRLDVQDAITKYSPGADNTTRLQKRTAQDAINAARTAIATAADYQGAIAALQSGRSAISLSVSAMDSLFYLVSALPETSNLNSVTREGYKTSISTQRTRIQTAAGVVSNDLSALQNAAAGYDSKISAQRGTIISQEGTRDRAKADILTYQAAIASAEAQLALKRAGTRKSDIDAAAARVRAAQANLARAQADFGDTVLTAPISGVITHVNIKAGEAQPSGPAITLLGDSPFRIEMFVSEIDVPKLQVTQSGSVELDAFRNVHMKLHVSEIDSSPTLKDGVSKYRVTLDFNHLHPELRIGMTGDAEIVTGIRTGAVSVPRRAVLENADGTLYVRVLNADKTITEKPVTIGMEGESGDVEVLSGVTEGETIIVLEKK